jgi:uncharacterized delta-60 repeat protein
MIKMSHLKRVGMHPLQDERVKAIPEVAPKKQEGVVMKRKNHRSTTMVVAILALIAAPSLCAFDSMPYPGPNPPDGSAAYPWKIDLPEDFDAIGSDATHLAGHHYVVTKDIDCGNQDHRVRVNFTGNLDGGYHTISGIRVDLPGETYVGLVGKILSPGIIQRLGVVDSYFRAHSVIGPVAGAMQGGTRVEKCYSQRNVVISVSEDGQPAGGIVGGGSNELPSAILIDSFARDNSVSSNFQTVGGVSGYNDARVERCYAAGCTMTAPDYAGGVVGYGYGSIIDSYSHLTNSPAEPVGSEPGYWENPLVQDTTVTDFDITLYSIAQLNWDPAVWSKGADNFPRLEGFGLPEIAVEQPEGTDLVDGTASIDFGNVLPGSTSTAKTFTVTNQGSADLTGLAVSKDGSHPGDFTVGELGAATLTPGASTTFTVTLTPAAVGSRSAALHLASNDLDENPFEISLSGNGTSEGAVDTEFDPDGDHLVIGIATQPDGKLVLGGTFTSMGGTARNRIARLNSDGTLDTDFNPDANGYIISVVVQADGKIVIAGDFTTVGGTPRNRMARLNGNGTLDTSFNPDADASIWNTAVQPDGKILIGGSFSTVGGAARPFVSRIHSNGMLDPGFNPVPNNRVESVAVGPTGNIVIGGTFTMIGDTPCNWLAQLDSDGMLIPGFNPNPNGPVNCIAYQADGKILIGGLFTTVGGLPRNRIARLHPDGTVDVDFNANANAPVYNIPLQADGKIVIGGYFTSVGDLTRNHIARLNSDGTLDLGFDPNANDDIWGAAIQAEGKIIIGGDFTTVTGTPRNHVARLLNGPATQTLSVPDVSRVEWLRGGTAPETTQVTFERWTGAIWATLGIGTRINGGWELTGLSLPASGTLRARARITGGDRNGSSGLVEQQVSFSGLPVPDIAVEQPAATELIDGASTIDFGNSLVGSASKAKPFTITNKGAAGLTGLAITAMVQYPGDFTVGELGATALAPGDSTTFAVTFAPGGLGSRNAMLNIFSNDFDESPFSVWLVGKGVAEGEVETGFDPHANSIVLGNAVQPDGKILIVGTFTTVSGVPRNRIARLNPDATLDTAFNPDANNQVHSTAVQADGKILIGGVFTNVGGTARAYLARLNSDGTLDMNFNPHPTAAVYGMAIQPDGKILIAGDFTMVGGIGRNRLARLNPDGTLDPGFNPNANQVVYNVTLQNDGKILVGGGFTTMRGNVRNRIARLNPDGTLDYGFYPEANSTVYCMATQADGKIVIGGSFSSVGGWGRNRVARLNADGTVDTGYIPGADDNVRTLAIQTDGKTMLGGNFLTLNGATRNHAARLLASGALDSTFNPNVSGTVYSTALQDDGRILIGGDFSSVSGVARTCMAQLLNGPALQTLSVPSPRRVEWLRSGTAAETSQTSFDLSVDGTTWIPLGVGSRITGGWELTGLWLPASGTIRARARTTGGLHSGSSGLVEQHVSFSGLAVPEIAVEQPTGTDLLDDAASIDFGNRLPGSSSQAKTFTLTNHGTADLTGLAITTDGSHPGDFTVSEPGATILAPAASTSFTVTFTPGALGSRSAALHVASNDFDENPFDIVLTGTGAAALVDPDFNPNADGYILSTALQPDGKIVIGGVFSTVGGSPHSRIARLLADGTLDAGFNPAVEGSQVHSIAVQDDGRILIAGFFSTVGGAPRNLLARLHPDGTLDTGFDPNPNNWPACIVVQANGKIIIGGDFTTIGGAARSRIARFDADGTLDAGFNPDIDGPTIYSAAVQTDGKIVIGGAFSTVNGAARIGVARLNADGTLDTGFDAGANGPVYVIALQDDGRIVISGSFSSIGGAVRNQIARLHADGTVDTGFDPNLDAALASAVVQVDGKIVMGGYFTTVGGTARPYLARLHTNGTLDTSFEPAVDGLVYSTELLADGTILLGGPFTSVDGTPRNRIARLLNGPATQSLTISSAARVEWLRGGTAPETTQVSYALSTDGMTWTQLGVGTRISGGWELTGLSLPASGTIRAQAHTSGGNLNGSSALIEQQAAFSGLPPVFPEIAVEQPPGTDLIDGTASIGCGSVMAGASSAAMTFTLINHGVAVLTGIGITTDGPHPGDFGVDGPGVTSLAAGASTTFTVTFTPSAYGSRSAALHIASNDADEDPFDIELTGTGLTALEAWRLENFGSTANTGEMANSADEDHDGVSNLMEYAFGLDPTEPSAQGVPPWQQIGSSLTCTFTRPPGVSGILYGAEWSPSMAPGSWLPLVNTATDPEYSYAVAIDSSGHKFARLKAALFEDDGNHVEYSGPWNFEFAGGVPVKLVWQTEIGISYELLVSNDLVTWAQAAGYPLTATADTMEYAFGAGPLGFYKIVPISGEFLRIPAGSFQMGGYLFERPRIKLKSQP